MTTELTWLKIILQKSSFVKEDTATVLLCLILHSECTSFVLLMHTNGGISLQMNSNTNHNIPSSGFQAGLKVSSHS